MSELEELVKSITDKQSALMQTWLVSHAEHYPGASVSVDTEHTQIASCSCGAMFELTVVVNLVARSGMRNGN